VLHSLPVAVVARCIGIDRQVMAKLNVDAPLCDVLDEVNRCAVRPPQLAAEPTRAGARAAARCARRITSSRICTSWPAWT
jgi:hypothetical protein